MVFSSSDDTMNHSVVALPSDVLQRICSLFTESHDLANFHLAHPSFCAAARATLTSVEPQHPGFVELALRHRYPLRHLSTLDLPFCDLGSHLAKAPSSLTSLDVDIDTLQKPATYRRDRQYLPMGDVLQGICSLRRLSCPAAESTLDFLQPHLAGLQALHLSLHHDDCDFQGLQYLTQLTHLKITDCMSEAWPLSGSTSVIASLTRLRCLHIPALRDPSPLAELSHLTAFGLGGNDSESCMDDENVVALVDALPQLRALDLGHFANLADTGLSQMSKLCKLQHLRLNEGCFAQCTSHDLAAALATMTGLEALSLRDFVLEDAAMAILARMTALTALTAVAARTTGYAGMLAARGPTLQRLSISIASDDTDNDHPSLLPAILKYCPQLAQLDTTDLWPHVVITDKEHPPRIRCSQLSLSCHVQVGLAMACVQGLRRLDLRLCDAPVGYRLTSVIEGLQGLVQLEAAGFEMSAAMSDGALCRMLEAMVSCRRLTWLQLSGSLCCDGLSESRPNGIGVMHLRALAKLPELTVLNLGAMEWEDARVKPGLDFLVARLPRLRVFNAPAHVLLQHHAVFCDTSMEVGNSCTKALADICYELQDLPGRRLRRWPRLATRDENLKYRSGFFPWPVLQPHRWLWDD